MTRKRILIVDDEIGCTRLLKVNLEMTNLYEVRVENRPENAVRVAVQFQPHIVLLDLVMPTMSGVQVAKAIRNEPALNPVPIALMTAVDDRRLPVEVDPSIASLPRITKPACMEEILRFLQENLQLLPVPHLAVLGDPTQSLEARI